MKLGIPQRILAKTIAQDLVSVVPMGKPTPAKEKIPTITEKIKPIRNGTKK